MTPVSGGEGRDEQIWREGGERRAWWKQRAAPTPPWDGEVFWEGWHDGNVCLVGWTGTKCMRGSRKIVKNAKILKEGGGGEGNFPGMQVIIWCTFIPVVFICHLSQGFIIISAAKLLWHIWRLPLNAAANNAGSALRAAIHSLPQVAIHIKTSKDMRGRAHIKAWWCLAHPRAHPPTPSIPSTIHPSCGSALRRRVASVLLSRERGQAPAEFGDARR